MNSGDNVATNTKLTEDIARQLVKGQKVICPCCNIDVLVSRYKNKNINTEYKCLTCGEIYHPCKII